MVGRLAIRTCRVLRRAARAWAQAARAGHWTSELAALWEYDPRVCPYCGRTFSYDVEWEVHGGKHWRVLLCCGECGFERAVVLSHADAARLEARLAADADAMTRTIARLDAERMATEVDDFVELLRQDRIAPGDFAPPRR